MAETQNNLRRTFLIVVGVVLAGMLITLVVLSTQRGLDTDVDETGAREDSGALGVGSVLERLPREPTAEGLVLADYRYDPGAGVVEGSVMNNTNTAFVNVQVGFDLLSADSNRVGQVRDTTRSLGPGESWTFRVPVIAQGEITRAVATGVTAGEMNASERVTDPSVYPGQAGQAGPASGERRQPARDPRQGN